MKKVIKLSLTLILVLTLVFAMFHVTSNADYSSEMETLINADYSDETGTDAKVNNMTVKWNNDLVKSSNTKSIEDSYLT